MILTLFNHKGLVPRKLRLSNSMRSHLESSSVAVHTVATGNSYRNNRKAEHLAFVRYIPLVCDGGLMAVRSLRRDGCFDGSDPLVGRGET